MWTLWNTGLIYVDIVEYGADIWKHKECGKRGNQEGVNGKRRNKGNRENWEEFEEEWEGEMEK